MPEQPVATRLTTWPLGDDGDRRHWDEWSQLVQAARHPSLARVTEVRRDEHQGALVVADRDSEAVTAWVDRTGASVPERLAVLRAAAAALDALHSGTQESDGLAHGGVSDNNVRVDRDGAARVVGFTPWAGTVEGTHRFLAPELVPGAPATKAGDVYAFARLVAEVLGGPAVAAAQDAGEVVRELRVSPDTRRRTRLVKAVHTALTSPADARPQPLTAWLTAAVEGTAVTEVGASGAAAVDAPPEAPAPRRRYVTSLVALGVVAILAASAGWALRSRDGGATHTATPPAKGSRSPQASAFDAKAAWAPACGPDTGLASDSQVAALDTPSTPGDLERSAAGLRVGRWHSGTLLLTLPAWSGDQIALVTSVEAQRVGTVGAPIWVARQQSCTIAAAPSTDAVAFHADLDRQTTRPTKLGPLSTPSGEFALQAQPTAVRLDVTACEGSYGWTPVVHYSVDGEDHAWSPRDTVYYTYGPAAAARLYRLAPDRRRPATVIEAPPTGSDCGRVG